MRSFFTPSLLTEGNLALALAPALTPAGIDPNPCFFSGFAVYPQVLSRGLLVLADITSTRYFNYTPVAQRDPVLSAQGDRLRAECFSAENGVYARLDLQESGFDGQIGLGTTNVDIGSELRTALTQIGREDRLHVRIGEDGLGVRPITAAGDSGVTLGKPLQERPVNMPDRWVRALGNAAGIHRNMQPVFTVKGAQAQAFVAALPAATSTNRNGWLTPTRTGVKVLPRRSPGAAFVSGLHRLSALKRAMTNITSITLYMLADGEPGPCMVSAELPGARLTLSLTAESWQGYSGEGALLESLAQPKLLEDMESIHSALRFDPGITAAEFARRQNRSEEETQAALALLAVSGMLGYDVHDGAYFHRELPEDPDRVLKDNPRLVAAQKLIESVKSIGNNTWTVPSGGTDYRVTYDLESGSQNAKCTCTWYLKYKNSRGPCKHILAVQLKEGME